MTRTLVSKLLRDNRTSWIVVALLLFGFQLLWARVAHRISADLLAALQGAGFTVPLVRRIFFQGGPGQLIQAIMGGEGIQIDKALDLMSISYVHPVTQTALCVFAIGKAAGAIAGEIDKGTMELLMAQPLPRRRLILAHLIVDSIAIPLLCGVMWSGTWLGTWMVGFTAEEGDLRVNPHAFLPALASAALLLFAVSGLTMAVSAAGRSRNRVLGLAVIIALAMFLVNLVGQLWPPMENVRPFTVFYYYQPQPMILKEAWYTIGEVWLRLGVLAALGTVGYGLAAFIFTRRDLPAPL